MSEATEQMALFEFLATMEGRYELLSRVFHVPNGEKREKATAARLKAMGVKRGVWDVWAPFHNRVEIAGYRPGFFVGCVIEMKSETGPMTQEQLEWRHFLTKEGWYCAIFRDWRDAAKLILRWVGGDPEEVQGL